MLSVQEKKAIFRSFDLKEKLISNERLNYLYTESKQRGQVLVTQLSPSGNGYVNGKYMPEETIKKYKYTVDPRGWISIKDFSKEELITVIVEAKKSMSGKQDEVEKLIVDHYNEKNADSGSKAFTINNITPPPMEASIPQKHKGTLNDKSPNCLFVGFTTSLFHLGLSVWKKTALNLIEISKNRTYKWLRT